MARRKPQKPRKSQKARPGRKKSTVRRLTVKEASFVAHYLVHGNAAQAARLARYSEKNAARIGHEMLRKPHIVAAIEEAQAERAKRLEIDADGVLRRLAEELDADLIDIFDPNTGGLKPMEEWPPVWRRGLIAAFELDEILGLGGEDGKQKVIVGYTKKVKLSDRLKRLELIGRHVKVSAFRERVSVEVPEDSPLAQLMKQIGGRGIAPKEPEPPKAPPTPAGIVPKE